MPRTLFSKNQLATELGVDRRTLDKRLVDIQPAEQGPRAQKYDLKSVFCAFIAAAEQEANNKRRSLLPGGKMEAEIDGKAHAAELASARLRRELADAELAEIKVSREKGLLIEAERVGDIWDDLTATMRTRLLSLPNRLSTETEGKGRKAVERRAEELVYEALKELSAPADYNAEQTDADDEDDDAD